MKKTLVIGIVVGVHVIVGLIVLMPGCATPEVTDTEPVVDVRPVQMPPPRAEMPIVRHSGVADLPFVAPEPSVVAGGAQHIVKRGETLSKIAAKYGVRTAEVAALNSIRNINLIRVGQVLRIPAGASSVSESRHVASPVASRPAVSLSGDTYVVKSGDCLSKIAAAHGVKLDDLRRANGISGDLICVGQKLVIPEAGGNRPATVGPSRDVRAPVAQEPAAPSESAPPPAELRIPSVDRIPDNATASSQPDAAPEAATTMHYVPHVVEDGQDLYTIAMMYNVRVPEIRKANGIPADGTVSTGQKLRIPLAIGE